ncbi:MAG: hypothetical protein AB8I56_07915 [Anaerolineales bacterium]
MVLRIHHTVIAASSGASTAVTPTPAVDVAASALAGTYRFHPVVGGEDFDYRLILNTDGSVELDEVAINGENISQQDATGLWVLAEDEQGVIFDIDTVLGETGAKRRVLPLYHYGWLASGL